VRHASLLISFSGLDGAGKSTQIQGLCDLLARLGYKTNLRAFWDHVVVFSRWRESFVHKAYGSERGVGAPGQPVARRDKNVRHWYLTLMRHVLYLLDVLHLRRVVQEARRGCDVLILDRYIYDELANLPLRNPITRVYVRWVQQLAPKPDIAFVLDADPEAAVARKPEYPLDFMRQCRAQYHELARQLGTLTVIPPLPLSQARQAVTDVFMRKLAATLRQQAGERDVETESDAASAA